MTVVKKKVEAPKTRFVKISEHKAGDSVVVGTYLGAKEVDNFNKDGKTNLHLFADEDGLEVGINGTTLLDKLLSQVQIDDMVEITFLGKVPGVSKDGKKFKRNDFEVNVLVEE